MKSRCRFACLDSSHPVESRFWEGMKDVLNFDVDLLHLQPREDVAQLRRDEAVSIPSDFDYSGIPSLSAEVRQKLVQHRPATIAQAGRIEGVTPAAVLTLLARIKAGRDRKSA